MTTEAQTQPASEQDDGKVESVGVMVNMPKQLKAAIEAAAKGESKNISSFVREAIASHVGYDGPLGSTRSRSKYASDEERAAAIKARENARRSLVKQLMTQYEDQIKTAVQQAEQEAIAKLHPSATPQPEANTEAEVETSDERPAISGGSGAPSMPQSFENR